MILRKMIFIAVLMLSTTAIFAQKNKKKANRWLTKKVVEKIHNSNPDLNLTEEQSKAIIEFKTSDFAAIEEIESSGKSEDEKEEAKKTIYKGTHKKIKEILTKEQFNAWKEGK